MAEPGDGPVASLIVPLRASPSLFEWRERLARILAAIPHERFETLVVDYGTGGSARTDLDAVVKNVSGTVRLLRVEAEAEPFSIGQARDLGAMHATAPVILFNDIDFLAPASMYEAIAEEIVRRRIASRPDAFFCVPVIFLTESATREYLAGGTDAPASTHHDSCRWKALDPASGTSVSIAYSSSCMVANRHHYLAIGGHDRSFWGHGAEDFELMHRIAATTPRAPRPPFYYADFKDNGVHAYRGFRAAFALYGIEAFQRGIFLVHLHHPSRPERSYNRRRKGNFRLLRERMERFDRDGIHPPPLPDRSRGRTLVITGQEGAHEPLRYALPLLGELVVAQSSELSSREAILARVAEYGIDRILVMPPTAESDLYAAVRAAGVPVVTFRRGALPDSWVFDRHGNGINSPIYDRCNWDIPLDAAQRASTADYLTHLRTGDADLRWTLPRAPASLARSRLGLSEGDKMLAVVGSDAASFLGPLPGAQDKSQSFPSMFAASGTELGGRPWRLVHASVNEAIWPERTGRAQGLPGPLAAEDLIAISDAVLTADPDAAILAAALEKPVVAPGATRLGELGLAGSVENKDDLPSGLAAPRSADPETVLRFVHYLRARVYSFGPAARSSWNLSGDRSSSTTAIVFGEIRGLTPDPVLLARDSSFIPLDSPVFQPFGGRVAIEHALRLATLSTADQEAWRSSAPTSRLLSTLALEAYRIAVGWRLPRRERILLRHVPAEVLATRNGVAARLLLRMLGESATGRGRPED